MFITCCPRIVLYCCCCLLLATGGLRAVAADNIFMRAKVLDPPGEQFRLTTGGHRHAPFTLKPKAEGKTQESWNFPKEKYTVKSGEWSEWIDVGKWRPHGRLRRAGGTAEWPSLSLSIARVGSKEPVAGCRLQVQLADKADEKSVVIDFTEQGGLNTIGFLCPHPLREKKDEFETASQMTARQLQWAMDATGGKAPVLKQFDLITFVWSQKDPILADQAIRTLKQLGFNVAGGVPISVLQHQGLRTYGHSGHYMPDPGQLVTAWQKGTGAQIAKALTNDDGCWKYSNMAHLIISDEISTLSFKKIEPAKLNGWFHDYLWSKGETDKSMGTKIAGIAYPTDAMSATTLPRDADLSTRKVLYYAAKFGQWWSVKQLRQTTDLFHEATKALPKPIPTETLPSDHHFFNAWGPPACGMDYRGLDFFEIGQRAAVDIISAEDWMGLNHMYGPNYTWTGGWAFGYLSAIFRSGIGDEPVALRALITPSDEGYLRLKAYSALGQGAKSLFYWTFGPTYIGTENYWSDLRSEYNGIAKVSKALEQAEDVLMPAKPVRDPVALLYSVSHDYWHTDDPAGFVENRLTWTALRHLDIQPDILREDDVEAGRLNDYRVLYITGQCLTRKASAAIDAWVKQGGVVYLCGGAATRDEFFTPYLPKFSQTVWPDDAAQAFIAEGGHRYNERMDLPTIAPLTTATVTIANQTFPLKVIGCRLNLRDNLQKQVFATFADGKPAGAVVNYSKGAVVAVGFLPGLAYSPFKAKQTTLDEVWPAEPRLLFNLPLKLGLKTAPVVVLSTPVVEGSLLTGPQGSVLVLANYTYQPIEKLTIRLSPTVKCTTAISTEGVPVALKQTTNGPEMTLPLTWTEMVVLK